MSDEERNGTEKTEIKKETKERVQWGFVPPQPPKKPEGSEGEKNKQDKGFVPPSLPKEPPEEPVDEKK